MDAKDRAMLVKLMGMTGSDHDGEALAAVRKATALLARNKTTWAEILGQATPPPPGSAFRDAQRRWDAEHGQSAWRSSNPGFGGFGTDPFREAWERSQTKSGNFDSGTTQSSNAETMAAAKEQARREANKLWEELVRAAGYDPEALRSGGGDEKTAIARARLRLDAILKRTKLDERKREHFEAIRKQHQRNGYINPAHRAQIDRAYYSQGWDEPLGGVDEDKRF